MMARVITKREILCDFCGDKLERVPSAIGTRNYCGHSCKQKNSWKTGKLDRLKTKVELSCEFCSKKFLRNPGNIGQRNFCSHSCSQKRRFAENDKSLFILDLNSSWSKPTIYNGIQMRSKLETRVASLLDSQDIKWIYEPKRFIIKELNTTYLPDFYLPEFNIYLDPKGRELGLEKIEAFRRMGNIVVVVRDKEVGKLEKELNK